jgi:maleate isomerase
LPDRYGPRGVVAVVIPVQNSNMQPEYELMRPEGISHQMYRFDISDHDKVPEAVLRVVPDTLKCWPDVIIGGNSLEMRDWSDAQQTDYRAAFEERAKGVPVVLATDATVVALKTIGARRIGVLSPMSLEHSKGAKSFYEAQGFEMPHDTSLMVKKSEDIINMTADDAIAAFERIDMADVDTLLHIGGALGIVSQIEAIEARFGKPLVSVNAATYWYALRKIGVNDPIPGFGQLVMHTDVAE